VHAEDTIFKIASEVTGFSEEIALWQDEESAPIAYRRDSLPYYVGNHQQENCNSM
jgi:hypothetical protein